MSWGVRYSSTPLRLDNRSEVLSEHYLEAEDGSPITIQVHKLQNPLMGLTHFKTIVGNVDDPGTYQGAVFPTKVINTPNGSGVANDENHPLNNKVIFDFQGPKNMDWRNLHKAIHEEVKESALRWLLAHHRS